MTPPPETSSTTRVTQEGIRYSPPVPPRAPGRAAAWLFDVGLAYVGGIVLGAPLGLLCRAVTGKDAALTATMVAAMVVIWMALRRRHFML